MSTKLSESVERDVRALAEAMITSSEFEKNVPNMPGFTLYRLTGTETFGSDVSVHAVFELGGAQFKLVQKGQ